MNRGLLNTKTKYIFGFLYVFLLFGVLLWFALYPHIYQDYSILFLNRLPEVADFYGGLPGSVITYVGVILFPLMLIAMVLNFLDRFNIISLNGSLRKNGAWGVLTDKAMIVILIIGAILGASVYIAVHNRLSQAGYTRCHELDSGSARHRTQYYTLPQDCQRLVDEEEAKREQRRAVS